MAIAPPINGHERNFDKPTVKISELSITGLNPEKSTSQLYIEIRNVKPEIASYVRSSLGPILQRLLDEGAQVQILQNNKFTKGKWKQIRKERKKKYG